MKQYSDCANKNLFSLDEKKALLQKWGFVLKDEILHCSYSCYHNQVEQEDVLVTTVKTSNDEYYQQPSTYNYTTHSGNKNTWVERVFEQEFNKRFKQHVLNTVV